MVFGTCYVIQGDKILNMKTKSVNIEGLQKGLLSNFEITQIFYHSESSSQDVSYFFLNDMKICIYDLTFVVGEEIIKPMIQSKEEAQKTYEEAVDTGKTAIYGSNIDHGMSEFKLGNLPPETECRVILKIAFVSKTTKQNAFFIKFPLDVYSPEGSKGCLDVNAMKFNFKLQCDTEKVSKVTSNVKNYNFDEKAKIFTITEKIENEENEKSIIINFETTENIKSSALIEANDSTYENCMVTISPDIPPSTIPNREFVFLVDCSGSMSGKSIVKASECLEVFIRSLPIKSYFNIICFGSTYKKLFDDSVEYNENTMKEALSHVSCLRADLGGTELLDPLKDLFCQPCKLGQRQVFIITDGEVWNVEGLLNLISTNSRNNRCFTIGIGRGCDAGLVEGIARVSNGKSDFVQEGDSISEKVIPQLLSSIESSTANVELHIGGEGNDSFEISPFPIPPIYYNSSEVVFVRSKKNQSNKLSSNGFLAVGTNCDEPFEIPIEEIIELETVKEDRFGCSDGKNIGKAIFPLFAFILIQAYELNDKITDEDKAKVIELSIASGVLSKFTGYVGVLNSSNSASVGAPFDICQLRKTISCNAKPICVITGRALKDSDDDDIIGSSFRNSFMFGIGCGGSGSSKYDDDDVGSSNDNAEEQHQSSYSLMNLIKFQKFDGCWDDLNIVEIITGSNINKIDELIDLDDEELENKCIATILAIAALHVKSKNERNTWLMIEQKAISWLKTSIPNVDVDAIIKKVENLIGNIGE